MIEEKKILRKQMKKIMEEPDSSYRINADRRITENILTSKLYKKAHTIFTFITMGNEIDVKVIIEDALRRGKVVCGPKCFEDKSMEARRFFGLEQIETGILGIPEPIDICPPVPREKIDLVFIPCLTADPHGYRVGYGAGYYDRYLYAYDGETILFCRDKQMQNKMPVESHDLRARYYVSEKGLFKADL